jgi:hypothetical protein
MRSATLAKLALTATVGIGALIGQSTMASAGPGPQQGSVKLGPAPTTTIKPIPADPADYCDFHLCLESTPVDPQPDPPFDPDLPIAQPEDDDDCPAQMPNCDKAPPPQDDDDPEQPFDPDLPLDGPDQGCQLTHGCPDEDEPGDDEPCRSDHDARTNCEGGTDGTTDGGTDGTTDGTTDGGTDGTTGGHDGRLPKTGVEVMSLVGLGAGGVGIGAVLKRLGRRSKDQDQ